MKHTIWCSFKEFARDFCKIYFFNISNERGMCSTKPIHPILKKNICLLTLYIILPSFIKIGQELFEINRIKTDRHTHRHIHADEYKDCPKTKFLGQVMTTEGMAVFFCFFFFPGLDYISFLTRCYTFVIASVLDC